MCQAHAAREYTTLFFRVGLFHLKHGPGRTAKTVTVCIKRAIRYALIAAYPSAIPLIWYLNGLVLSPEPFCSIMILCCTEPHYSKKLSTINSKPTNLEMCPTRKQNYLRVNK